MPLYARQRDYRQHNVGLCEKYFKALLNFPFLCVLERLHSDFFFPNKGRKVTVLRKVLHLVLGGLKHSILLLSIHCRGNN